MADVLREILAGLIPGAHTGLPIFSAVIARPKELDEAQEGDPGASRGCQLNAMLGWEGLEA